MSVERYTEFLSELHAEQRAQNAAYVELRLSPRRMLNDGMGWSDFVRASDEFLRATVDPVIRGILLLNRDCPESFIDEVGDILAAGLPPTFVGIDLAGDEIAHVDVSRFEAVFSQARAGGLGVTVHAGEFGGPESIWRAIDQLGAARIGHGLAATKDRVLLSRLARDRILLELSITSNVALGAVGTKMNHPVRTFYESGIPLSFNSDVPLHTGCDLDDELRAAYELLGESAVTESHRVAAEHLFFKPLTP